MHPIISIGKQNFASLRENNCFYIDKSDLIREWWESQDEITLITRPRRFGKTLNMSMLNYFFSTYIRIRRNYSKIFLSGKKKNIRNYKEHIQ